MAAERMNPMNREEFFAKLAPLDAEQLRKVLWNDSWRGSASVRERIEGELAPAEKVERKRSASELLDAVTEFAELMRSGAYMAGDSRVSRERSPDLTSPLRQRHPLNQPVPVRRSHV
jgi:hypothetical protein